MNVVFLPGLLCDARLWEAQVRALGARATVQVADMTTGGTMAALAADVLARAPTGRFALAGLSMGGYCALEIVRQAPERVAALALLDTSARPDTPEGTTNRRRLVKLAEHDFDRVVDELLPKLVAPAHLADPAIAGVVRAMARAFDPTSFARQQEAIISRADSRPLLPTITCPTLVLCGREDALTPPAVHEEMAAAIPRARLVLVDGSGHLSPLERPEAVTAALAAWLDAS
jgi:pimeloyl-ACP methyl ester carboxylesterase